MLKTYWLELEKQIKKNNLDVNLEKIKEALVLAEESHKGQYRKSGESYILHPVEVAQILIDLKMDTDTIVAAILHDIVEDTEITLFDIEYHFGKNIAEMVDGVTKLDHIPNGPSNNFESIRKMILAMSKNLSVVIIKLADRLHNMRTLKYMKPERQVAIAQETLDIYAALAHRLGFGKIKWELEDLCLKYLHPQEYVELKSHLDLNRAEREAYISDFIKELKVLIIGEAKLEISISGRFKHFYSIYKKIYEKGKSFGDIYDLIGIRIIAKDKTACYHILGIIQSKYQPVPGRYKDYILTPKANNYQSIHTTVIGPNKNFVEIQIRTEEMDRIAEDGIAAHWNYKEKTTFSNKNDRVYGWIRGVIEDQQNENSTNSESFVRGFTQELLKENVFIYSPKGDVVELSAGATPIDFAFQIHTDVGCKCVGAKVNGKIVPLDYKLTNGDKIEIITTKNAKGPSIDWLNIAVTTGAKNKIRKWLKDQHYLENVKLGKELMEKELEKIGKDIKYFEEEPIVKKHMEKHHIPNFDEIYFQFAESRSKIDVVLEKIRISHENDKKLETLANITEVKNETREKNHKKNDFGIIIDGADNTLLKFAKCCTPLPGDEISGYVTKLTGITIHRKDCSNFKNMVRLDPEREIETRWDPSIFGKKVNKYKFSFVVYANERQGLLMDIMNLIANHKLKLITVNSSEITENGNHMAKIKITIEISEQVEYKYLEANMLKIKDVVSITR